MCTTWHLATRNITCHYCPVTWSLKFLLWSKSTFFIEVAKCFPIAFSIISDRAVTWTNQVIQDLSEQTDREYTYRGYKREEKKKKAVLSHTSNIFLTEVSNKIRYQSRMKLRVTKWNQKRNFRCNIKLPSQEFSQDSQPQRLSCLT